MELILGHREVDDMIDPILCRPPPEDPEALSKWTRKDKTARMAIGISLSDEMLKNVRHTTTALEMWQEICNVHQRHTLLNKLAARRDFYTATMKQGEQMLVYINRVRQMASHLESMDVKIDEKEMAMAVLNGLPSSFRTLITALDAIGDDDPSFAFDKVRSRLLQEERRTSMLRNSSHTSQQASALVNLSGKQPRRANRKYCSHCHRTNHTEPYCWEKHGRPNHSRSNKPRGSTSPATSVPMQTAAVAMEPSEEEVDYVCLLSSAIGACNSSHERKATVWHIDSAATSHITFDRSMFKTYTSEIPFNVTMGDKSSSIAIGRGDIHLPIIVKGVTSTCILRNVLHVPSFVFSLISVSTLTSRGLSLSFINDTVEIKKNNSIVALGTRRHGLYTLHTTPHEHNVEVACVASLELWHRRLGHVHHAAISHMAKHSLVKGLQIAGGTTTQQPCKGCLAGKMARAPIPHASDTRATGLLDLVHTDVAGPMETSSKGGARYFVTFIDDKSRWLSVYPIAHKSDSFSSFQHFRNTAETHTGRKIRQLRSDGGGEYFSNEFSEFLITHGITRQTTAPYTPQQNGVSERMNRTLKDLIRAMLHHNSVPADFWAEALDCAAYVRNRVTSRGIPSDKTPFELWMGRKPDISHLKVFGSQCWYKVPQIRLTSLNSRSSPAMMIGYSKTQKAYKLWDDQTNTVVISRDVVFDESASDETTQPRSVEDSTYIDDDNTLSYIPDHPQPRMQKSDDESPTPPQSPSISGGESSPIASPSSPAHPTIPASPSNLSIPSAPRKSSRPRKPPTQWWKPTALVSIAPELLTFTTATEGEDSKLWLKAIDSEMESLYTNQTWILVPRSEARNLLSCKWLFKIKDVVNDDGTNGVKYKARLVTRGFEQQYGVDYEETYAPVVKLCTLRTFLAIVAHKSLHCDQMDVKTAFLYGDLDQDIYMEQPEGFVHPQYPNHVCKLQRALYGLKQAPRQWHAKIDEFVIGILKFETSPYDPCLYVKYEGGAMVIITLYVDDLLMASSNRRLLDWLKGEFNKRFSMKDCGEAKVCLGLEIVRSSSRGTLHLSQSRYVHKVLERFGMLDSSPVVTPMESQISPADLEGEPIDSTLYRSAVGSLMYLSVGTRPDISFAVGRLAQHVEHPTTRLWTAVKRVLRYLNGTRNLGLLYQADKPFHPIAYSDSDWGGCTINRKSTSGYVFLMAGGAVSWKSRKQGCVALSSSEAEYMALCAAVKESIWLSNIFRSITASEEYEPICINVDNQGSINMARNDVSGTRTKHIDIQYHFVRDSLDKNLYTMQYCPTSEMAADLLTKPLPRLLLHKFKDLI